jgi:hypothetical protein
VEHPPGDRRVAPAALDLPDGDAPADLSPAGGSA